MQDQRESMALQMYSRLQSKFKQPHIELEEVLVVRGAQRHGRQRQEAGRRRGARGAWGVSKGTDMAR